MIDDNRLSAAILTAIHKEIESIIDEEAKAASKRIEDRIRARTGTIAAKVLQHFSIERFGTQLRILVDFENTGK